MNRKIAITGVLLVALAVAVAFGSVAYSSARAATRVVAESIGTIVAHNGDGPFGRGEGGRFTDEDLANALGISVDELEAAYQEANDAALAEAVDAGLITQAQADELSANGNAFPFGGRWGGWLSRNGIDYEAHLAEALGISVEDLRAAYTEAFNARVDQAVADGRLSEEQAELLKGRNALFSSESFQSSMQSAFEAAVSQAVAQGVITQSQADQILEAQQGLGFPGFGGRGGRGFGGFDGPHGPGRGGWRGDEVPANPLPTETIESSTN
ncbi:MAG: hypothetical protein EHM70_19225, partial [Chloroflexota bacterium]